MSILPNVYPSFNKFYLNHYKSCNADKMCLSNNPIFCFEPYLADSNLNLHVMEGENFIGYIVPVNKNFAFWLCKTGDMKWP